MKSSGRHAAAAALIALSGVVAAQAPAPPELRWGLQNTFSYSEGVRPRDGDAASRAKGPRTLRAFEFKEKDAKVREPMLKCFQRHDQLWDEFRKRSPQPGQEAFEAFKRERDPFCDQFARQLAPSLYFDFNAPGGEPYVLQAIEVRTLGFSEYRGGGFARQEAWYDIVLPHKPGTRRYPVDKRLSFTGTGRCELRLWSDNQYPAMGWLAPMGEYTIDIRFIFSAGGREVSVATGPFKVDV